MSTLNLLEQRARLNARITATVRRVGAAQDHLRGRDGRVEADVADRPGLVEMDEVLEQAEEVGHDDVAALRIALARLDAGTYTTCAMCGGPIDGRRLQALPATSTCAACAT